MMFAGNWREVTWVSNYSYPITPFCNWIAVIGHLCCTHVNQMHLNGFFFAVVLLLSNEYIYPRHFKYILVHIDFLISNFVVDAIN